MADRSVLLVSPYFPPIDVIGSKRGLNLARHLPTWGWQPLVLANRPRWEPTNPFLQAAIPPETVVSRDAVAPWPGSRSATRADQREAARSPDSRLQAWSRAWKLRLQYATPLDRYAVDIPFAVREGLRLIERHAARAIWVNADPWAGLVTGAILRRMTGLPLVFDLRDPWTLHPDKMCWRTAPSRAAVRWVERMLFAEADRIVLNTSACRRAYVDAYRGIIPSDRFAFIRNAFDEALYESTESRAEPEFHVVYFGSLRLSVGGKCLLEGFRRFVDEQRLSPDRARLSFVGKSRAEDRAHSTALGLDPWVEFQPPVPLHAAMGVLRSAHTLVLINPPSYHLTIPGKLYDYLAAQRPVLALSTNPELEQILGQTGAGEAVAPTPAAVAAGLRAMRQRLHADQWQPPSSQALQPFTAVTQARAAAAVLDEIDR